MQSHAAMTLARCALASSAALTLVACGGAGADDDAPTDVVGSIQIEESRLDASLRVASIYAQFIDPGAPDVWNDGTCRVYEYPCLGQVGACGSPPQYSAGPITVGGLTVPVRLVPDAETHSYSSPGLPADLFAADAAITVTATGAGVPGFEIATAGVTTLESPPPCSSSQKQS